MWMQEGSELRLCGRQDGHVPRAAAAHRDALPEYDDSGLGYK